MKHTGGKWRKVGSYIFSDSHKHIATVMSSNLDNSPNVVEQNANADLIVMAPRMYKALKLVKKELEDIVELTSGITATKNINNLEIYAHITDILEKLE